MRYLTKSPVKQEQMGFLHFISLFTNSTGEVGYNTSEKLILQLSRMGRIH